MDDCTGHAVEVVSKRGLDQGDPLASPDFAISLADPARELKTSMETVDTDISIIQVADDIQICTVPGAVHQAADELRRLWSPAGLSFCNDT